MALYRHLNISSSFATAFSSDLHLRRTPPPIFLRAFAHQWPNLPKCSNLIGEAASSPMSSNRFLHPPSCRARSEATPFSPATVLDEDFSGKVCVDHEEEGKPGVGESKEKGKSFWGAVTLIIGTAVGPGMLGLPSATIRSGLIPSTIAIILSWVYVVSSIILVAELSFAAMEEDGVEEVSFTSLATNSFGPTVGALVAIAHASLSFSLLIACVSGIGTLATQQFPMINPIVAHALFPCFVGTVIGFFPFKAIDMTNRTLCGLMLFSITALVVVGLAVGRSSMLGSLAYASWRPDAILPAIPVTVLTLGFHIITPFACKLVGSSMRDARKAILLGGAVPLAMVLSWNMVVLGLAGSGAALDNPIKLLLSVKSSALPAVQGFAFAALATSLIGYAVSIPKQLADTVQLIAQRFDSKQMRSSEVVAFLDGGGQRVKSSHQGGHVGSAVHARGGRGAFGDQASSCGLQTQMFYSASNGRVQAMGVASEGPAEDFSRGSQAGSVSTDAGSSMSSIVVTWVVLVVPIFIASFFQAAFSKALDFAGVYANCFLFGVLPPAMAWIHRSRRRSRSSAPREDLLPGGTVVLVILFSIAVILGCWH